MLAFAPTAALLLSAAPPPALWIELPGGGKPCSEGQVAAAIRERRPGLDVRTGAPPQASEIHATLAGAGGEWALTVEGGGLDPLRRALPAPGSDCVATAETAALMLDRYLDDIRWGPPVAIGQLVPPTPPPRFQLVIEAGPSLGATAVGLAPLLELDVAARRGPFQLGLGGAAALPQQQAISPTDPTVGTLSAQLGDVRLVAGWRPHLGPGTLRLELAPGTELLWVSATGPNLFQQHPGFGASPYVGARVGYEIGLPGGFALALRGEGRVFLSQAQLGVVGGDYITTPPVDGNVALTASRVFF